MGNSIFVDIVNTLKYLRNDDFGWGEFKTQSTRLTNTCEAVWALGVLGESIEEQTIEFVKKAVRKENLVFDGIQNCTIPRDYGWALIALTNCKYELVIEECDICIKELISDFQSYNINGFGTRNEPTEYSTFHTAIILIGLIKVWVIRKDSEYDLKKSLLELINNLVEKAEENIIEKGWGGTENSNPEPSYTGYMLYAFCLYHNNINKKSLVIKNAINFLEKSNLETESYENDSRPDSRPYRHFTLAWILISLCEYKDVDTNNFKYLLAKKITILRTRPYNTGKEKRIVLSGWSLPNQKTDLPTTWATALASISLKSFCEQLNCFNFIETIPLEMEFNKNIKKDTCVNHIPKNKNIFIIHGHDISALRELERILKENYKLNPIILMDKHNEGLTLIEKFEKYANDCSMAIALFTPDDEIENNGEKIFQARPNVIWEFGWFAGRLGRNKVILVLKKGTSIFSDIGGVIRLEYNTHLKEIYLDLQNEFNNI